MCVDDTRTAGEVIQAVANKKTHILRGVFAVVLVALLAMACSSSEPAESASATPGPEPTEDDANDGQDDEDAPADPATDLDPVVDPEPTLDDQDLAGVVELDAGEQIRDAQGNLIAIYGLASWPESFVELSDSAQEDFPFFGDVATVADPASELVVLDVGMCAAGIDASGFGTAEFFVHESPTEILSTDPVLDRGILARHPIVSPGFDFPGPAECERGFLPILWSGGRSPVVARYVLATRASASAEIEQHVYQWELDAVEVDPAPAESAADRGQFAVGQTVTFNQGRLDDTTIVVEGWAELIGTESPIEGTRLVAVSMDFCPSSSQLPEFGLGVDSWNIVAPVDEDVLGAAEAQDPASECFEGWLEFAIPFGSVPTAFFASDGSSAEVGYAEWSLDGAALPAPQS